MSEQREREEIEQIIKSLDRAAAEIRPKDRYVAGGMEMSADFLRWTLFQEPKHGVRSLPMMIMAAKAKALIGTDE